MFCLSFVIVTVRARLAGLSDTLEQAAMDLYATPNQTFWRVTFPLVFPGILGAALLAFSLSFDDFIITNLNAGNTTTFPMYVWGVQRKSIPMQVNVIGTLMLVISILIVVGGEMRNRARQRALAGEKPQRGRARLADAAPGLGLDPEAAVCPDRALGSVRTAVSPAPPTLPGRGNAREVTDVARRCDRCDDAAAPASGGRGVEGCSDGWSAPQRSVPAFVSTSRRICSISSKCSWSQISGGASWTTGSPRSSARQ